MNDDEISEEELQRRMERKLFGRETSKAVTVGVRNRRVDRPGHEKPAKPRIEVIRQLDRIDPEDDLYDVVMVMGDGRRAVVRKGLHVEALKPILSDYRRDRIDISWKTIRRGGPA